MTAALTGEGLTRTYGTGAGAVRAVAGVDVRVDAGELVVVRGRSGSGKTTLLNLLGGLERPTSGRVLVGDRELTAMSEDEVLELRRRHLGYVFQSFGLVPSLSAAENVEVPLRLLEVDPAERDRRVAAALDAVGLARHARQRPAELSGGQQQRVGIARALVADPRVLLADEPTGQLDSSNAVVVMDLLADLVHTRGVAALVTTHDPLMAERADRVLELHSGRLHG
ncbi:ABC transporter ATP-binding protein [Actinotalea ferrariae]|uniref:ABC transporter ATP-binding protein n=1 Tax=Actinotalea ferrariae TaxID=1386098 RepID=UPI001C8B84C7|nr:ABC transporter ATP-binding protein [Actinotalea ferrariae]MBX9244975.1 ABC transporter ATP-binding protein [Actinotalea ferrariae]